MSYLSGRFGRIALSTCQAIQVPVIGRVTTISRILDQPALDILGFVGRSISLV